MASRTLLLDINDLRGGRNGVDSPLRLEPDQCVEAINIDWYLGTIGRKRTGAAIVALGGTAGDWLSPLYSLVRHIVREESDNELWAFDGDGNVGRLAANVWHLKDLVAPDTAAHDVTVVGASFNRKLFLAYDTTDSRLHVWDGTAIRPVGILTPPAPGVSANAGTGITGSRWYRVAFTKTTGGVTTQRSEMSPAATLALTNQGGWVVTRPALRNEGENTWELYAGATANGPWYLYGPIAIGTMTYTDTIPIAAFPPANLALSALVGAYTLPPDARYLAVDEARLILAGRFTTVYGDHGSRLWWTPVLNDASGVGNDERLDWTVENVPFIDFDPGEGGDLTGLGGPLFDAIYIFKFDRIYKITRTGVAGAPYRPVTVSRQCGAIRHQTIVLAEDEAGHEALYFLSRRGPYRLGANGLQYCGRDIEDLWATVDLTKASAFSKGGAHGIYHQDLHQVWWWVPTGTSSLGAPDLKLVFDVKQGRFTEVGGVRRGWCQHTGNSAFAWSSVMYSDVRGTPNSLTLKPYIGNAALPASSFTYRLWKCDDDSMREPAPLGAEGGTTVFYTALIRTRAELPGGSVAVHGGVIEGHLVGYSLPYTGHVPTSFDVRITTVRDFGLEARSAVTTLGPTVPPITRTIAPVRDLGAASAAVLQLEITDNSASDETWVLDQVILRVRREEDR